MEINLQMQVEYNSYNSSILSILYQNGHITAYDYDEGIKAVVALRKIYERVKGGKSVGGRIKIVGLSE